MCGFQIDEDVAEEAWQKVEEDHKQKVKRMAKKALQVAANMAGKPPRYPKQRIIELTPGKHVEMLSRDGR